MSSSARRFRCAIYTRKSSDEGLEQNFNSLHAQREACEAYVLSQAGEGWTLNRGAFDDGGFSGGSMDRPALKALMAEIEAGRVDIVVVYKVDRLTRSLMDFARIVEAFDRKGVSFVSVTQAFNTTTSMGRLTLNVLLSFAQFEREVTGERIRDKIAASKAKGMWMGGNLALGYDVKDRALVVNEAEAETVRMIFRRYLEVGSVPGLKVKLDAEGCYSKTGVTGAGTAYGGKPLGQGALFYLLKNRLYLGEITHKEKTFPGLHAAIVDLSLFDDVQAKLAANAVVRRGRLMKGAAAALKGIIFDQDGAPMSPSFGLGKGGQTYRYYVSQSKQRRGKSQPARDGVRRVSAPQLEALIGDRLQRLGSLQSGLRRVELLSHSVVLLMQHGDLLHGHSTAKGALGELAMRIPADDRLSIEEDGSLRLVIGSRPVFRGGRTWLVNPAGAAAIGKPRIDTAMVAALRRAHRELKSHRLVPGTPPDQLLNAASPVDGHVRKLMRLAFLAPDIQQAILEGRQPPGLTASQMLDLAIPCLWSDQRTAFGFPS